MTKKIVLNFSLITLLILGNIGTGYSADSGTGKIATLPTVLWHYFPDQDVQNPEPNINVLVMSNRYEDFAAQDLEDHTTGINFASLNVSTYDPQPDDFMGYDAVLLFEDGIFDNTVDVGNAIYGYQQGGGGVVLATFVWQDWSNNEKYAPRPGWGNLELVSPLISDTQGCEYSPDSMGTVLIPDHPIMNGVSSIYAGSFRGGTQISPVGTALALWFTPNFLGTDDPLVAIYEPIIGGRTAAISVIPHYGMFGDFSGDYYQLFENALNWVATIGTGTINGHVKDASTGDPIERAFAISIKLPSKEKAWAFTDENGYYEIGNLTPSWYLVITIKKGYNPGIKVVKVEAGKTTTRDFELNPK